MNNRWLSIVPLVLWVLLPQSCNQGTITTVACQHWTLPIWRQLCTNPTILGRIPSPFRTFAPTTQCLLVPHPELHLEKINFKVAWRVLKSYARSYKIITEEAVWPILWASVPTAAHCLPQVWHHPTQRKCHTCSHKSSFLERARARDFFCVSLRPTKFKNLWHFTPMHICVLHHEYVHFLKQRKLNKNSKNLQLWSWTKRCFLMLHEAHTALVLTTGTYWLKGHSGMYCAYKFPQSYWQLKRLTSFILNLGKACCFSPEHCLLYW